MAVSSGSALALAARLRALDDDALERLVRARDVRRPGIRDHFDLAEALLDRGSIQAALQRLDRATLALLAVAGGLAQAGGAATVGRLAEELGAPPGETEARVERALELGLLGRESGRVVPWDAVVEQLGSWPSFGLPSERELVEVPPPAALEPVSEADARFVDRGAADRAFATVSGVAELLLALREEPARRLSRGGLALPDARRLAPRAGVEPGEVELLLELAALAELAVAAPRSWEPRPAAEDWLAAPQTERWAALAAGWLDRLPEELRELLRGRARAVWGDGLLDYLEWRYPAGGEWVRERVGRVAAGAELLGILGSSTPSSAGSALLAEGVEAAAAIASGWFPQEVDRVYLQNDLTIVAPGPLAPAVDLRLRRAAELEARGLASSYRVTAASVTRALVAGETAEGLLDFLAGISLTGVPQPLDYLVRDTAARFGSVRVGPVEHRPGERSAIRSSDPALLSQLLVDPRLAPLALREGGEGRLVSRFELEIAYWTLHDARYPVVAEDAEGRVVTLRRARVAGDPDPVGDDTAAIVVARLRDAGGAEAEDGEAGWIVRQLELAAKNRVAVSVTVRMPDGSEQELLLEPAAIAGGRLRARDRRSDLERTLPISSVTAVETL